MANRVFQGVIYQMKDAVDRVLGVVDETGTIISCSELTKIGEVRDGIAGLRSAAWHWIPRSGRAAAGPSPRQSWRGCAGCSENLGNPRTSRGRTGEITVFSAKSGILSSCTGIT